MDFILTRRVITLLIPLLFYPLALFPAGVRIGVFGLFRPKDLSVRPLPATALVIEGGGQRVILTDGGAARLRASGEYVQCLAGDYSFVASVIRGSARGGEMGDFLLSVPGKIERTYRGTLEVSARDGQLMPVVRMGLELATASAVAAESPPGALLEALKAQAVATRSFYIAARHRHVGFDFCDTTHCQFLREPPLPDSPAALATRETRGLVLTYQGAVLAALFSASCGGHTHALREIGIKPEGYPFYSVRCPYCLRRASGWRTYLQARDAWPLLAGGKTERARIQVGRRIGWSAIPGNNYEIHRAGETVVIQGIGEGHGVGLCQRGAGDMAGLGARFQDILNYYYPNTSLAIGDE